MVFEIVMKWLIIALVLAVPATFVIPYVMYATKDEED
jgi:hypothetical protein